MRIVFATTLLCIVFATAYADVRKVGDEYFETKNVEIPHGTIKDIKQEIERAKQIKGIHERERSGYDSIIIEDDRKITDLESNFKTDIDADDALVSEQENVETP